MRRWGPAGDRYGISSSSVGAAGIICFFVGVGKDALAAQLNVPVGEAKRLTRSFLEKVKKDLILGNGTTFYMH